MCINIIMDGADAVNYILQNNIEGCIVECGVESGDFEYIFINELMKNNSVRDIYLYDTFAGLVEPSEYDYTCNDAKLYQMNNDDVYNAWKSQIINENVNGWCFTPLYRVKDRLNSTGYPQNNLHYIVGNVMETLKDKTKIPEKIAILRLDTDWYESSKYELEQMYDNVVTGGIIIFDDYYHWDGQRRATDEFFLSRNINYDFVNIGNYKTAAIIKK
jgi:O-methyltransferase